MSFPWKLVSGIESVQHIEMCAAAAGTTLNSTRFFKFSAANIRIA